MMMVENTSLPNEEIISTDAPKHTRPCAFIPPPPPNEPPPEDGHLVSYSHVMGLDMVDVGVETSDDSCGPDSTRSSPVSSAYLDIVFWFSKRMILIMIGGKNTFLIMIGSHKTFFRVSMGDQASFCCGILP